MSMQWIARLHARRVEGRRTHVLADRLAKVIPQRCSVLDVGCGDGRVGKEILRRRPDLKIEGVEVLVRDAVEIPVQPFDGVHLPFPDRHFDVVLFTDVLHHTADPMILLREASRVAQRCIVIKDHLKEGVLGAATLRFMDFVGNSRYGVVLPYNYWKREQWKDAAATLGFEEEVWSEQLHLYPWPFSLLFDRSLHVIARWKVRSTHGQ